MIRTLWNILTGGEANEINKRINKLNEESRAHQQEIAFIDGEAYGLCIAFIRENSLKLLSAPDNAINNGETINQIESYYQRADEIAKRYPPHPSRTMHKEMYRTFQLAKKHLETLNVQ
jgi:hypothetical protein